MSRMGSPVRLIFQNEVLFMAQGSALMQEIYFDNSATTQVSQQAAAVALQAMREDFGNPSSVHGKGAAAFHALNEARSVFARYLDVASAELYFTSCGTESNNIVLQGAAKVKGKSGKIIVSAIEHPSVYEPTRYLLSLGYDVAYIPVDCQGIIQLDSLEKLVDSDTVLVSIMHVNNETGAIQPLREAGRIIKNKACQKKIFLLLFHRNRFFGIISALL